jgi:hypothetical protein
LEQTTNYGFYKPNGTDYVVDDRMWKTNWDKVDTQFNEHMTQLANISIDLNEEPIIIPEANWSGRLQRAINRASIDHKNVLFSNPSYEVSTSIYLKSNVTLLSFCGSKIQGIGVTEVLKTDGASTYENIKLLGVEIDAGKVYQDDNIRVCSQFYNVTGLTILNSKFRHGSAAVGLDTCEDVFIFGNTIEGMYQQTNTATTSPGTYGYGVVVNESNNVLISANFIGTEKPIEEQAWIDRHAVYVSNHGTVGAINSTRVFVTNNSIVMKPLSVDTDMVTGFEYALKSIGGDQVFFRHNTVLNGVGMVLLSQRNTSGGRIVIEDNTVIDCLKGGVLVAPDTAGDPNANNLSYDLVEHRRNNYKIKGEYAVGIKVQNVTKFINEDNEFISTIADTSKKSYCYYMQDASLQAQEFTSKNNRIKGFLRIGRVTNVDHFTCEDVIEDFPVTPYSPFDYIANVNYRDIEIKFANQYYSFKADTFAGLVGLSYFDRDLDKKIRCVQTSPPLWRDNVGRDTVFTSTTRPIETSITPGIAMYEQDLARKIYYTGYAWATTNNVVKSFGTKAEILAIPTAQLGYSTRAIYNTDDKKPYWYDAFNAKWKDSVGTILV